MESVKVSKTVLLKSVGCNTREVTLHVRMSTDAKHRAGKEHES